MSTYYDLQQELQFLRWFFANADTAMGPADHDVYCMLMETYEAETGDRVPPEYADGYIRDSEEDEYGSDKREALLKGGIL